MLAKVRSRGPGNTPHGSLILAHQQLRLDVSSLMSDWVISACSFPVPAVAPPSPTPPRYSIPAHLIALCCLSVLSPRCCCTMTLPVYRVSLCPLWSSCCFALMYSYRLPGWRQVGVVVQTRFPTAQGFGLGLNQCGSWSQSWPSDLVWVHQPECRASFIHVDPLSSVS